LGPPRRRRRRTPPPRARPENRLQPFLPRKPPVRQTVFHIGQAHAILAFPAVHLLDHIDGLVAHVLNYRVRRDGRTFIGGLGAGRPERGSPAPGTIRFRSRSCSMPASSSSSAARFSARSSSLRLSRIGISSPVRPLRARGKVRSWSLRRRSSQEYVVFHDNAPRPPRIFLPLVVPPPSYGYSGSPGPRRTASLRRPALSQDRLRPRWHVTWRGSQSSICQEAPKPRGIEWALTSDRYGSICFGGPWC
jgi:hypothetical protein